MSNEQTVTWAEWSIERNSGGLSIWVKVDPKLEEFAKSLGDGQSDSINLYGKGWQDLDGKGLQLWRADLNVSGELAFGNYTLHKPHESFREKSGKMNLTFLRFVGVSEGVRFGVPGRFSKAYANETSEDLSRAISSLVRDFIVPVHMSVKIYSQDI